MMHVTPNKNYAHSPLGKGSGVGPATGVQGAASPLTGFKGCPLTILLPCLEAFYEVESL